MPLSDAPSDVAGVLLAAGEGQRFGGVKALIRFHGEFLVERGAAALRQAGCDPVVVVLGAGADMVQTTTAIGRRADVVVNPAWAEGMGGSLRAGLAAARRAGARAALVLLVDQPLVTAGLLQRLIAAWRQGAPAVVAARRDLTMTPALLDRSLWDEAEQHAVGESGARALLRSRPELVTRLECDDEAELDDIDTPEDLVRLSAISPPGGR